MGIISMRLMPPKTIGRKVCLQAKGLFGLSKDSRPKRCPNIWKREESKEVKDFMKVKNGSVHHNKYDGRCTK